MKLNASSGPYYTYLAGFGHEDGASAVAWAKVPDCVTNVRNVMQDTAMKEGREDKFRVDQMTILAWHATGNRKVSLRSSGCNMGNLIVT